MLTNELLFKLYLLDHHIVKADNADVAPILFIYVFMPINEYISITS